MSTNANTNRNESVAQIMMGNGSVVDDARQHRGRYH